MLRALEWQTVMRSESDTCERATVQQGREAGFILPPSKSRIVGTRKAVNYA